MSGSSLLNENLNGISDWDDFFKFLDFPLEDVEGNVGEDWNAKLELLDPPSIDVLVGLSPGFSDKTSNDASKCPENLSALVSVYFFLLKYSLYFMPLVLAFI